MSPHSSLVLVGAMVAATAALQPTARLAPRLSRFTSPQLAAAEGSPPPEKETPSAFLEALPAVAAVGLLGTCALHAPAFANIASQWQTIRASGVVGDDFWAPLQFWAFFASMHPLLQPAIWIGEVLHGSPGPQLADVMPISFIALNVVVIGALNTFAELRTAVNVALLAAFIHYVGCGIEGSKELGEYNLALDDGVRGCPTYEQVRQPSMATFDPTKYTGKWYEHYFHDWTQFSDVYDTTLEIEVSGREDFSPTRTHTREKVDASFARDSGCPMRGWRKRRSFIRKQGFS